MDAPLLDPRDMDDAQLAAHLAEAAGDILLQIRASGAFSGKALGQAGDETANQFLVHALGSLRPDDGLLSEEEKDNSARLSKSRVWIIDPVDGTREYGEARADWAVHVGLAVDGAALIYNNADTYLPDLLICRPDYAEQVLALVSEIHASG